MGSADVEERVCLRRFGLNFDPPSLVLEYERPGSGRLFHRRIGLRRLGPTSDPSRTAEKIRRQNKALLAEDQVPFEQLVSVVARLQARQGADKALVEASAPAAAAAAEAAPDSEPLRPAAAEASSSRSPADAPEVAPAAPAPSTDAVPSAASSATAERAAEVEVAAIAGVSGLPELEGELNLNVLSTEELDKYKARMDVEFFRNQSKPGDPGFKFDVRVDHVLDDEAQSCGWDDSDEED